METYRNKLKTLLGIPLDDTSQDGQLDFALETVIAAVLANINHTTVPVALDNVVVLIARDFWRAEKAKDDPTSLPQTVQSVKRGDVTTTFSAPISGAGPGAAFVQAYEGQLKAYRKMRW